MKKILTLVLLSFFNFAILSAQENYKNRLLEISDELAKYVESSTKSEDGIYKAVVIKADTLLREAKIKLKFTNEKKMISSVNFVFDKQDRNPYLEVSKRFIETYDGTNAIHYSILVREYANIYHFSTYNDFRNTSEIPKQFFYKAEGMKIQTNFIERFLQPAGLKISAYEESLIKSKHQDNFEVGMRFLERTSIYYTQFLQDIFTEIQRGKYPKTKTLKQLNEFLLSIIPQYNKNSKISKQFYVYTSLETFDTLIDFYLKKLNKADAQIFASFSQNAKTILKSEKKQMTNYYENTILNFYETKIDNILLGKN
ncbi:MAG: hypothetical protein P1P64_00930 [Treponemataceae bacterium]